MAFPTGNNLVKLMLYFVSAITFIAAITFIVIGSLALTDLGCSSIPHEYVIPSILLISAGVILMLLIVMGTLAAVYDSIPLLIVYSVVLAILLIMEVVVAIVIAVLGKYVRGTVRSEMEKMSRLYKRDASVTQCVDKMQQKVGCCGIDGPQEYVKSSAGIPESCCYADMDSSRMPHPLCKPFYSEKKFLQTEGCYEKVVHTIYTDGTVIFCCVLGLAIFHLCAIILSGILAARLKNEEES